MEIKNTVSANNNDFGKFFFCDTSLRDGEQVNGVRYMPRQKVEIAMLLDKVGIESIDAGFAATSEEEREAIRMIADRGLKMRIMSMCRVVKADIDYAYKSHANGVILFIPGSDIHIRAKFGTDIMVQREKLVQNAVDAIKYAKDLGLFVEFGVEDSTRTEMNILLEILQKAEEVGADLLGTTDTIGCLPPEKTYDFIKKVVDNTNKPVGVHCHNDLGLATANTLAGLRAGAGYCSPTVNGIGERAGNAALEEVLMGLKVLYGMDMKYDLSVLGELCDTVQRYSKIKMDNMKPIIGENAYTHESGIHIHGMIKDVNTYEVFNPEIVGRERVYAIGKHIGKHTIAYILEKAGYQLKNGEAEAFWKYMKQQEEKEIQVGENNIISLFECFRKENL